MIARCRLLDATIFSCSKAPPDDALGKDAVLVERDQLPQRRRRETVKQQRVGRSIAVEDSMRHEPVQRSLRLHVLGGFAESQRFRLREDIGEQHLVMRAQRVEGLTGTPAKIAASIAGNPSLVPGILI